MPGRGRRPLLPEGRLIKTFDPWGSSLCTCPVKYSLNPYTGCSHFCLYCYATAYIGVRRSTPKKDYRERLLRDLVRIDPRYHIDISTSSDPYPPEEERYRLTRWTLEQLLPRGFRVLIITKGALVARDANILSQGNAAVTMTITTMDRRLAARLEPGAPPPRDRVRALEKLNEAGVPLGIRLDPVFPGLTDSEEMIQEVLEAARAAEARFVVTSIYKARPDNLRRMLEAFPELEEEYRRLYPAGRRWINGYWYAPLEVRARIVERVRRIALRLGMEFATCREGMQHLHTAPTCDGSHLIPLRIRPREPPRSGRLDEWLSPQQAGEASAKPAELS
ncbi:radical SAM protein [Pyrodictium occultum]|uniref:Radical SAM protein n=1 Tax=Pyrodictium occultum TaxID=2309 RepID=A0A0V8RXG3_PYROC|nr:radical SAM protein [Pyrodictium occultum]KSW12747.1 radical SAM protein [Pyrodictium occultum]